jgi:hypothetical protein
MYYPTIVTDPSQPAGCNLVKGQRIDSIDGPTVYYVDAYSYYFNSLDSSAGSGSANVQPACAIGSVKGACTRSPVRVPRMFRACVARARAFVCVVVRVCVSECE